MARVSKPMCAGVTPLPLRIGGRSLMAFGVVTAFPLQESEVLLAEPDLWQLLAPYLPQISFLDAGAPKVRGEWMLAGSTHAPGGALTRWEAEVRLGQTSKTLRVHGPRCWEGEALGPAEPVPSVRMDWSATWGGPSVPDNTAGCGVRLESGEVQVPRIELPTHPWCNPDDECRPACTLPLDAMHHRRRALAGTYGSDYLERYFPGMPSDFDWRFFNVAPADQQIDGFWQGDEAYLLRHWHPDFACIEGRLPGVRAALHVGRKGEPLVRVDTGLTTVWLFPEVGLGVLVFHGWLPSNSLDGSEFDRVLVGLERLGTPELPLAHYEALWTARTERTVEAAARAMDDAPLCPPGFVTRFAKLEEAMARYRPDPGLVNMGERMAKQWEAAAASLNNAEELSDMLKKQFPDLSKEELDMFLKDEALSADMAQAFEAMAEQCRQSTRFEPGKKPLEQLMEAQSGAASGLQAGQRMQDMQAAIQQKLAQRLRSARADLASRAALARTELDLVEEPLSQMDAAATLLEAPSAGLRGDLPDMKDLAGAGTLLDPQALRDSMNALEHQAAHWHQADADGAGLDGAQAQEQLARLREMVRSRGDDQADGAQRMAEEFKAYANMAASMGPMSVPEPPQGQNWMADALDQASQQPHPEFVALADADLSDPEPGCGPAMRMSRRTIGQQRFRGLDMHGAVMDEVTFIGCDFSGCNLSGSTWRKCVLIGCDLSGAVLDGATLEELRIHWSCLDDLQAVQSTWRTTQKIFGSMCRANFERSVWNFCMLNQADLGGSVWTLSEFTGCSFAKSGLGQSNFCQCQARQSAWVDCELTSSTWEQCRLERCNFFMSKLPRRWRQACLVHVCLRECQLDEGDWRGARFDGVDFSEARLAGSDFSQLSAKGLYMMGADLQGCDFSDIQVDGGMFIGADIRASRFVGASLGQCWFGLCLKDDDTDFSGADVLSCNFHPQREAAAP